MRYVFGQRRATTAVLILAVATALLAGGLSPALTPSATAAPTPATYRISGGTMHYDVDWTQSCAYPSGQCQDKSGGYRLQSFTFHEANDVSFAVNGAGGSQTLDGTSPQTLTAPMDVSSWTHVGDGQEYYSQTPCGATARLSHADGPAQMQPTTPSFYQAALDVQPVGADGLDVALRPRQTNGEPSLGWIFPDGLYWETSGEDPAGLRYPVTTRSYTPEGALDCLSGTSSMDFALIRAFEPADHMATVVSSDPSAPTVVQDPGCTDTACSWTVSGTETQDFVEDPDIGGLDDIAGSATITWSFVVDRERAAGTCHFYSADYAANLGQMPVMQFALNDVNYCQDAGTATIADPGNVGHAVVLPPAVAAGLDAVLGLKFKYHGTTTPPTGTEFAGGAAESTTKGRYDLCAQVAFLPLAKGIEKLARKLPEPLERKVMKWLDDGVAKVLHKLEDTGLIRYQRKVDWLRAVVAAAIELTVYSTRTKNALHDLTDFLFDEVSSRMSADFFKDLFWDGVCLPAWKPTVTVTIPGTGVPTSVADGPDGIFTVAPYSP